VPALNPLLAAYRLATSLAGPLLLPLWLRRRAARGKEIVARLGERYGQASLPRPEGGLVWFHAASVGETLSLLPVIKIVACKKIILLTTGTKTAAAMAESRLAGVALHQFVPLDVPLWTRSFLDHWQPDAAVLVESEIWPVMLTELDNRQIPRLLVNARISARAARQWSRAPVTAARLFGGFSEIHAQSAEDAARLTALTGKPVRQGGNLKFFSLPLPVDESELAAERRKIPGPVWLAASTHPGEEALVAQAHAALLADFPDLITIIVPRHPERGAAIAAELGGAPRRAQGDAPMGGKIYVADTLGELGLFYRLAPFAFVGSSLAGAGGHNVIEPARLSRPVICGPHMQNFAEAAEILSSCGGLVTVHDAATLAAAARAWLTGPAAVEAGAAAERAFAGAGNLPAVLADMILEQAG
jgi:3-deoxy-D-manno-octulosonic-acid transferase